MFKFQREDGFEPGERGPLEFKSYFGHGFEPKEKGIGFKSRSKERMASHLREE